MPAEKALVAPERAWVLRGDRGVTYSAAPPPRADIVAGQWWPADYDGPPLVSIDADIAAAWASASATRMTVNVLGRDIDGEDRQSRAIDWSTLDINFTMIFSPGVLEAAPQTFLATVRVAAEAEDGIERAVTDALRQRHRDPRRATRWIPSTTLQSIGIGRARHGADHAAGRRAGAGRGAVAAGHRRRIYDAVVLKVLGATARRCPEGLPGRIRPARPRSTAAIAGAVGTLTAWALLVHVMRVDLPAVGAAGARP